MSKWTSSQLCLHSSAVTDDAASTAKMGKTADRLEMKKEGVGVRSSIDYPLATGPLWLSLRTRLKENENADELLKHDDPCL